MCIVQVIFFVGVQLDITMPPTPRAAAPANAAGAAAGSSDPAEAATGARVEQAGQQTGIPESPAASQQVQSQVCLLCCTGTSTAQQVQLHMHAVSRPACCSQANRESLPDWVYLECYHLRHVYMSKVRQIWGYAAQLLTPSSGTPAFVSKAVHAKVFIFSE